MAGQGDIADVTRIVDTITGSAGAKADSSFKTTWTVGTPTLGLGTVSHPPAQGGFNVDAGNVQGGSPDVFVGSFTLQSVAPTLGVASLAAQPGNGDLGDVYGDAHLGNDIGKGPAGLVAFSVGAPTLVTQSHAVPGGQGDISTVGGPTTVQGDVNDSNAGVGTGVTFAAVAPSLVTQATTTPTEHGDIGEMYGSDSGPIKQLVWNTVAPSLVTQAITTPGGQGDIPDPYTWQDAVFYLTSQIYPIDVVEHFTALQGAMTDQPQYSYFEHLAPQQAAITGGTLTLSLIVYSNWPAEHVQMQQAAMTGGTYTLGLITYSNWPAEHVQMQQAAIIGGTYVLGLVTYSNWPAEHVQAQQAQLTGGTLT
jgi:hypothetical protein